MRKRLFSGARIVDPARGLDAVADLLVGEDGRVLEVGPGLRSATGSAAGGEVEVVPCSGLVLAPGFVDLHVHFREPGQEYKETIETGGRSAAAGGFTTVCCMANTQPVHDNASITRFILERAAEAGLCRVLPIGAVSAGMRGERLADIGEMRAAGAVGFSDDGLPVMDAHLMRRALEYTRTFGAPVIAHEEDRCLGCHWAMHEGEVSTALGLPGIPGAAEDVMVARDIVLAEDTGGWLHVAHVSTARSVELIRRAKERGVRVTTEATPHHFTLTHEAVRGYDTSTKMAPPLRPPGDVAAVVRGLADGTIDCVATDHAPHSRVEKEVEFELAANGVIGLETALGLTLTLVRAGHFGLSQAVALLSTRPAACFGIEGGRLAPGDRADLVLFDPAADVLVDPAVGHSRSRNTPFGGWTLPGRVRRTVLMGRDTFSAGPGGGA